MKRFLVVGLTVLMTSFVFPSLCFCGYPYDSVCPKGFNPDGVTRNNNIPGGPIEKGWWNSLGGYWVDKWGLAQCNCTSFCAYRMDQFGIEFSNTYKQPSGYKWGHGKDWNEAAVRAGIKVDQTPIPGDIVYWESVYSGDKYGHVANIMKVEYDDQMVWQKIYVFEYNGKGDHEYGERWITRANNPSGFIHIAAYHEGVTTLFYLDSWEMDTLSTEQTKEEWFWILKRVWNNYRCTSCGSDYNSNTIAALNEYIGGMGGGGEYDPEPTDPDSDPDLHISRFHIRQVGDDDYEHNVERTLNKGAIIYVEGELKVRNESTQKARDVDSDYRIESKRDFDDQDTKIDEDGAFDIDPGEKVSKYMSSVKIEVSTDGRVATVSRGSMSKNFAVVNNFVKIYFFADVEEPGGDQDISSETDNDEYAKVEIKVLNPPTATFSATPIKGPVPLEVSFINQSARNATSWSWNFGDGERSTAKNPTHSYTIAGSFTVSLTVTNADGNDTETKTNYIVVSAPAIPSQPSAPTGVRVIR